MTVRIESLSKAYGLVWALRGINIELEDGECVALLGSNGAGKTTLLKLLAGLLYPTEGKIELGGRNLPYGNSPMRADIGFLSVDAHLYDNLTVSENLRFFVALYQGAIDRKRISDALEVVGLARWASEYVSALSHGMRCRLAIAKWSMLQPALLLIDEPYGALDGSGVIVLENLIESIRRAGGIVIIATHNVARALDICSRAVILHQGGLLFNELRQEPWDSFHRAFAAFFPQDAS